MPLPSRRTLASSRGVIIDEPETLGIGPGGVRRYRLLRAMWLLKAMWRRGCLRQLASKWACPIDGGCAWLLLLLESLEVVELTGFFCECPRYSRQSKFLGSVDRRVCWRDNVLSKPMSIIPAHHCFNFVHGSVYAPPASVII